MFFRPLLQWKSITYCECVCSLCYVACNAHVPYCRLWPVPLCKMCPHYLINGTIFETGSYWTQNVCFDFLYNFCLKHSSFWKELSGIWSKMFIGLHVKYPLLLSDFNGTWVFATVFRKILKFHENPSSGSRVLSCGRKDRRIWRS